MLLWITSIKMVQKCVDLDRIFSRARQNDINKKVKPSSPAGIDGKMSGDKKSVWWKRTYAGSRWRRARYCIIFFPSSKVHKKRSGAEEDVTARNNTSFSRAFFPSLLGKMPFLEFEKEEEMAYWHLTYSAQRERKIRDKCCGNPDCVFGKWGGMRGQFGTFFSHKTVWLKPHSIVGRGQCQFGPRRCSVVQLKT